MTIHTQGKAERRPRKTLNWHRDNNPTAIKKQNNKKQQRILGEILGNLLGKQESMISRVTTLLDSNIPCSTKSLKAYKEIGKYGLFKGKK